MFKLSAIVQLYRVSDSSLYCNTIVKVYLGRMTDRSGWEINTSRSCADFNSPHP